MHNISDSMIGAALERTRQKDLAGLKSVSLQDIPGVSSVRVSESRVVY